MRFLFPVSVLCSLASVSAQPNPRPGTDVSISDLGSIGSPSTSRIGSFPTGMQSWGISTTSCNVGRINVPWLRDMNVDHPSIGMVMYRDYQGRFEQVSLFRGVKHGFTSTNSPGCGSCPGGAGTSLVVGCTDTYGASLNYSHTWMAPPEEIDPWTGIWKSQGSHFDRGYPEQSPPFNTDNIRSAINFPSSSQGYRNLVLDTGLNVSGATFWVHGYYNVVGEPDLNRENNFTTRQFTASWNGSRWTMNITGTQYPQPAIYRWSGASVQSATNNNGADGRFYVAVKVTGPNNGMYRYDYAVFNRDNNGAGGAVRIPVCAGARIENLFFRDPDDNAANDWSATRNPTEVVFTAPASNSLTWGNLYNFGFDSDASPRTGTVEVDQVQLNMGANPSVGVASSAPLDLRNLQLGAGCGSPSAPVLDANGPANLGNAGFALRVSSVAGGASTTYMLSASPTSLNLGACTVFVDPSQIFFVASTNANAGGVATLGVPIPNDPNLNQASFAVQAVEAQSGGAFAGLLDFSNGLKVKLGTGNAGCN